MRFMHPSYLSITCSVSFIPDKKGDATVNVKYGEEEVLDSPVRVPIKPDIDTSKVRCNGPGVMKEGKCCPLFLMKL